MELKAGYKRTELGVIPVEWKVVKIKEMSSITTGKRNTQDRIEDGVYPFFVRSSTVEGINSYSFDGEAVLTAGDGVGTGKVFHYINGKFDLHQRVYKISDFCSALDGYFFFLFFSNYFFDRIMSMTAKSSVDSVRREMIADMQIPLPSIDEQKAIKSALSDVDALIAALDLLIAKKRDIKQAAMQELLKGKRRLPGFASGNEYKQTEVGMIPADWDSVWLPDVCWFQEGPGLRQWQFTSTGIKVINVTNLENGYLNLDRTDRFISIEEFNKTYRHFSIDAGDIVVASSGNSYCKVSVVRKQDLPLVMNTSVIRFKPRSGFDYDYLLAFLKSFYFKDQIDLLITGGAQPNFGPYHLRKVSVLHPPFAEQHAIATVLFDMDAEIATLEARREKTRALKQGMMQELLTGRIRLV